LDELADPELAKLARDVRTERLRRDARVQVCARCASEFFARNGARFCSGRCRTAAYRLRLKEAS
jgi:ribosomal protein S27AE